MFYYPVHDRLTPRRWLLLPAIAALITTTLAGPAKAGTGSPLPKSSVVAVDGTGGPGATASTADRTGGQLDLEATLSDPAAAAATTATPFAGAAAGGTHPIRIVQIGDSYSAGNAAGNYWGIRHCYRSTTNWGQRYSNYLNEAGYSATYDNHACSGAVTADVLNDRKLDTSSTLVLLAPGESPESPAVRNRLQQECSRPQFSDEEYYVIRNVRLTHVGSVPAAVADCEQWVHAQLDYVAGADLVLLTIGGNDINFGKIVEQCFAVGFRDPGSCRDLIEGSGGGFDLLNTVQTQVVRIGEKLQAAGVRHVVLLSYPYLSNRAHWELRSLRAILTIGYSGDTYDAGDAVRRLGDAGDTAQAAAVATVNATYPGFFSYVDATKPTFAGHEPDPSATRSNPDRWIAEFADALAHLIIDEAYHPNPRGQEAEKDELVAYNDFGASGDVAGTAGAVDVVFAIDTTGSMGGTIDSVKASSSAFVQLLASRTSSWRVAVVDYKDQPGYSGDPYAAKLDLPFSSSTDDVDAALAGLSADGGDDYPEAVYAGIDLALSQPWRPGVRKVVIAIGDAPPHDPEPISGLTAADIIAHALAVDPASVYALDVSGGDALAALDPVADGTGGTVLDASSSDAGAALLDLITGALAKPVASAGGPYVGTTGSTLALDARGSYDPDGTIASYAWDFDGDGTADETASNPVITHTFTTDTFGTLTLTVTDNDGNISLATAHVGISASGEDAPPGATDNCPDAYNPGQEDTDEDGIGDACDPDAFPSADAPGVFEGDTPGDYASGRIAGHVIAADGTPRSADVRLSGADAFGATVDRSVATGPDGSWEFAALYPGRYGLVVTPRDSAAVLMVELGTLSTTAHGGSVGAPSAAGVSGVVLGDIGASATGYTITVDTTSGGPTVPPDSGTTVLGATLIRLAGMDRIASAIAISRDEFTATGTPGTPATRAALGVVIARADDYPDALAGTPFAVAGQAPLLLSAPAVLAPEVLDEVTRVLPTGQLVTLLGGTDALSPAVERAIVAAGYRVRRLAGVDRYQTARIIAEQGLDGPETVFIATGLSFPDGLAAGAAAARSSAAVLLSAGDLPAAATDGYLASRPLTRVVTVGGPASRAYPSAPSVAGADRYATSALLAASLPAPRLAGLATGERFADALVGGAHAAANDGVLLLTRTASLPDAARNYLVGHRSSLHSLVVYGGTGAVSSDVAGAASAAVS